MGVLVIFQIHAYFAIANFGRIVAIVVAFCFVTVFLFVPETFWDRTPRPKTYSKSRRSTWASIGGLFTPSHDKKHASATTIHGGDGTLDIPKVVVGNVDASTTSSPPVGTIAQRRQQKQAQHVGFAENLETRHEAHPGEERSSLEFHDARSQLPSPVDVPSNLSAHKTTAKLQVPGAEVSADGIRPLGAFHTDSWRIEPRGEGPKTPALHGLNSPFYVSKESPGSDYITNEHDLEVPRTAHSLPSSVLTEPATAAFTEKSSEFPDAAPLAYTHHLRTQPPRTFVQALRPWNGRLCYDNWLKVAIRPMILFAYPGILWSAMVYALSVGWLIVLSESMSVIFRNPQYTYNFSALGTGLVYISPFIGGILGTAVAGKVSDILVRFMARRNGGIYEPEFRLIMAIPVAITTCIGLMGFGWSAAEHDQWIVPTFFFGVISFGCSLGSTTAITFAVDSYRQYAGEALVTLNICKSKLHEPWIFNVFLHLLMTLPRYPARLRILPLLHRLAASRWLKIGLPYHRRHSARMFVDDGADVYLWEEGTDVDGSEEHDGEVLSDCFPGFALFGRIVRAAVCVKRHFFLVAFVERHWRSGIGLVTDLHSVEFEGVVHVASKDTLGPRYPLAKLLEAGSWGLECM